MEITTEILDQVKHNFVDRQRRSLRGQCTILDCPRGFEPAPKKTKLMLMKYRRITETFYAYELCTMCNLEARIHIERLNSRYDIELFDLSEKDIFYLRINT